MPKTNFLIHALNHDDFNHLFSFSDKQLQRINAKKIIVNEHPGYPCRVSLKDALVGETIIALTFTHHDVNSPYRSSGPIFVRNHCLTSNLAINEIPDVLNNRLLSLRAYNKKFLMIDALITKGQDVKVSINQLFSDSMVEYIHIHNAKPGCYSCRVERVID